MDSAYFEGNTVPLWLRKLALLAGMFAASVAAVAWTLRYGTFGNPAWWMVATLYVTLLALALVVAVQWRRGSDEANPGGFEVLTRKDDDDA